MTSHESSRKQTGKAQAEPEISWTFSPRIDAGVYPAFSRTAKVYRDGQFKRWVCAVHFDVLNSGLIEVLARLTWFLNLGDGEKPHAGRRTNYWRAWVAANEAPPNRKDRLSSRVFVSRYARVVVGDTAKDAKQMRVAGEHSYSVIREVLKWESGRVAR
jgi:hypothetical protein